jgi:hypothetical protein
VFVHVTPRRLVPPPPQLPSARAGQHEAQARIAVAQELNLIEHARKLLDLVDDDQSLVTAKRLTQRLRAERENPVRVGLEQVDVTRIGEAPTE